MAKISFLLLVSLAFVGCVALPPPSAPVTLQKFTAPLNVELTATTGESLFGEGDYIEGELITVQEPVDVMIPGSMFIPFPVHIAGGPLVMKRIAKGWKYYCGDLAESTASFPGLGTVVSPGDCIGIRVSTGNGEAQWVVDNSIHNRMSNTIWTRGIASEAVSKYKPQKSSIPFDTRSLVRITFDGYYSGQLHFSWLEIEGKERTTQKFVFDFKGPTLMGIKGKNFEVLNADNVGLTYRWVKF